MSPAKHNHAWQAHKEPHTTARSGSVLTGLIPPRQQIQVFPKVGQSQGQGHQLKNIGINRKVLSKGIDKCIIKALSLLAQKLWSRLSFFKRRSKVKVKVTR